MKARILIVICSLWVSFLPLSGVEAQFLESFEDVPIGQMPPAGWLKWEEAGGRGWSNSWAGRTPMPGWLSGAISTPPDPDAGSRVAYVTYTHGGAKTNDLWLISPTMKGIKSTTTLSFWYRSSFSNFADRLYVMLSTNPAASRKSDFTIEAERLDFPRGYPSTGNFPDWTNVVIDIGSLVPVGADIRIGFREYYWNNWYDVRANELDAIRSADLWAEPISTITAVRAVSPGVIEVDYYIFPGYPEGRGGVCWGTDKHSRYADHNGVLLDKGTGTCVLSNVSQYQTYYLQTFVIHDRGDYYGGESVPLYPGDSAGEGFLFESFEDVPIGQMPPAGWLKWEEAGGRGWSNSWSGRTPMPGWLIGAISTPPDPDAGSRVAYATYTHGGAKTNDLWLATPTLYNVPSNQTLSFWYRSSFSNFADRLYVMLSTNPAASRKSDFTIEAERLDFPRGYPSTGNFPDWTNVVIDIGSLVPAGSDIRIGFQEYYWNNWYDVRANELDVVRGGQRVRYALRFDGNDDYVRLPIATNPTAYTLEAWVKPSASGAMNILTRTDGNPLTAWSHQLRLNAAGQFEHSIDDGSWKTVTGTTTIQTGRWYHVAGTAQSGGTMALYVNGNREGAEVPIGAPWTGGNQYRVGCASGGGHAAFDGVIDEVRIWSAARDREQIRDAMNIYQRGVEPGLDACYRFDCTWGAHVFDSSYPARDASLPSPPERPAWIPAQTPLGDWRAAGQWNNRGLWATALSFDPGYGLSASISLTNTQGYIVTGHNHSNGTSTADVPAALNAVRLARIWHVDVHEATNESVSLTFCPADANASESMLGAGAYSLWKRTEESGAFTVLRSAPDAVTSTSISFYAVSIDEGYYTLGLSAPIAPSVQPATNRLPFLFYANWTSAPDATNYLLDVSTDPGFASYVNGYQARPAGAALTMAVTGLLSDVMYHYRVRAQHAGGISTNSSTESARTRRGGGIGLHTNRLTYTSVYGGADPAAQSVIISNIGEYVFSYTTEVAVAGGAMAWLSITPPAGTLDVGIYTSMEFAVSVSALNAGTYTAQCRVVSGDATNSPRIVTAICHVARANQTVSFPDPGPQISTNTVGLTASASSGLAVSYSIAGGPGAISGGSNLTFTGDGNVAVTASQAGNTNWNPAVSVTHTLTVVKAEAAIAFSGLNQTYDGTARVVTPSTTPTGLTVGITYDGALAAPTNAGSYAVTGVVDDIMYRGTNTALLTVARADQTITFPAIGPQWTTNRSGLSASASSGLTVGFAVVRGPASITGATNLTFNGTGIVRIAASQPGDANWNPSLEVTNSFTVTKASASVMLTNLLQTFDGSPRIVDAETSPTGLLVRISYNGLPTAPTNAGGYAVTGVVDDIMYRGSATGVLTVLRADQTIAFANPGPQSVVGTLHLSASALSGLPVSFSLLSGPASWVGATTVTFSATGTVAIAADQAGNGNWNPAATVTQRFAVYNTPPEVRDVSLTNGLESVTAFTSNDFMRAYSDADGDPMAAVRIEALPSAGELLQSGSAVTGGQVFSCAELDALTYSAPTGAVFGAFTFPWRATDGYMYSTHAATVTVVIVNDYPPRTVTPLNDFAASPGAFNTHIELNEHFTDPEGLPLDYDIVHCSHPALFDALTIDPLTGVWTLDYNAGIAPGDRCDLTLRITDAAGLWIEVAFSITIAETPSWSTGPMALNFQNGLFEQWIWVTNDSPVVEARGIRLIYTNIVEGISVYNATGQTTNDQPIIEYVQAIPAGGSLTLMAQYYSIGPDPTVFPPQFHTELMRPGMVDHVAGPMMNVYRTLHMADGRLLIEFRTVPGRWYCIQYRDSLADPEWQIVMPYICAPAGTIQWIDSGPPATYPHPDSIPARYYRVIEVNP